MTELGHALDIVIKTHAPDFHCYQQLQRDLLQHSHLEGTVYVMVPESELAMFREVVYPAFRLMPDQEVLALAGYTEDFENNWYTQQIIKLAAAFVGDNDAYLVLDANTLLNHDFDESYFLKDGKLVYGLGGWNEEDLEWERQTRAFLCLPSEPVLGFRAVNQVFRRKNVKALSTYVEYLKHEPFITTLLRHARSAYRGGIPPWTEFSLYGVFCRDVASDSGHTFIKGHNPVHWYNPFREGVDFEAVLAGLRRRRPLMMKCRKQRGDQSLSCADYLETIRRVKECYQD